jgi:hypothetical protein
MFCKSRGFGCRGGIVAKILDAMARKAISEALRKRKQPNHGLSDSGHLSEMTVVKILNRQTIN